MTSSWSFELNWERPPKGLSANDRVHWAVKNESTQDVRRAVSVLCRSVPKLERIAIQLVWYVPDKRRRDPDNIAPLAKAVADGICADKGISARIVPDDAPQFAQKIHPEIVYEPGRPARFVFTISDLSHPNRSDELEQLVRERLDTTR